MNRKEKLISNRLSRYCSSNLKLLDKDKFIIGDYIGNYRCHYNAVQKATLDKKLGVILVLVIDGSEQPIVHFINTKGDKYIDNTWGYQYKWSKYYFIKEIDKKEFEEVQDILFDAKNDFLYRALSGLERFFYHITEKDI
jgi:hypothetical protein